MKLISLIIVIGCTSLKLFGQTQSSVFHSSGVDNYSKTDFSKSDSLNCWFYVLTDKNPSYNDSVKPVGQLVFQRTHALKDTISENLYKNGFLPNFTFQVFDIKDSVYCFKKSQLIKAVSSCTSPDVGGDIIIFGNYIFLNNSVCLHCKRYDNGVDYCRPIINKVFLSVDKRKAASLEQIVKQFPIKGQVIKLPF
jgi:hypothetical protein